MIPSQGLYSRIRQARLHSSQVLPASIFELQTTVNSGLEYYANPIGLCRWYSLSPSTLH
jgi:hypothetical protein